MSRASALLFNLLLLVPSLHAEEGMWTPEQLPRLEKELRQLGLPGDAGDWADLTGHPLNAVVSLGGCSASFVSPQGLIATNHHCAFGSIQHNSTPERNLLESGFLASTLADELPAAPGSRVFVTVEFRDVTDEVLAGLSPELEGLEYYEAIEARRKALIAACEEAPGFRCEVPSYYGGMNYRLARRLELRDVRLVYAPPSGIGVFGGDIDNWMWPRQTGDFAFYRAYTSPDGLPADHNPANVPYRPAHYLEINPDGVREGDLVLIAGYPGSTSRHHLASEVEDTFGWNYPQMIRAYAEWLDAIDETTRDRPEAAIKYAGLKQGLNNVLKNREGMLDGFAKSPMVQQKRTLEAELREWIDSNAARRERFGGAVSRLEAELEQSRRGRETRLAFSLVGRSALLGAANTLYRLAHEKGKPDPEREPGYQERDLTRIGESMRRIERTFDPEVDRAVLRHFLIVYHRLPAGERIPALVEWFGLEPGRDPGASLDERLRSLYEETELLETRKRLEWMEAVPAEFEASTDPFVRLAVELYETNLRLEREQKESRGRLLRLRPLFMEALIAFLDSRGRPVYPEANGTLRISYGTVQGYRPRDGTVYLPFTTLEGVVEKDTGEDPFNTPEDVLRLMREGRYGRYLAPELGSVPVNFLSTCDATGGNSGSATLDRRGRLVGLLFDGNYESMISDWDYMPGITRSIHVDIRYLLWTLEESEGATELLKEMGVE